MSIYDSGPSLSKRGNVPPQSANPKQILIKEDISELVKQIKGAPSTVKELLYDVDKNLIGVIDGQGNPFFFNASQEKEMKKLLKEK